MENEMKNNQLLINYLSFMARREAEKPLEEIDCDYINACVEMHLHLLNKKQALSPEEIEKRVRRLPFGKAEKSAEEKPQGKVRKIKKKKILLIAAVIVIIAALFALISTASEWTIYKEIRKRFGHPANMPYEVVIDANNESFFGYKPNFIGTLEEAKANGILKNCLIPKDFEGCPEIKEVNLVKLKTQEYITIRFNGGNLNYTVYKNEELPQQLVENKSVEVKEINGRKCYFEYLYELKTIQAHFKFNGNHYFFTLNYDDISEQVLLFQLIENLEVFE